jgi:hypothetical protein
VAVLVLGFEWLRRARRENVAMDSVMRVRVEPTPVTVR